MTYDHHKKAGNQGDVVKHVALLAALDTILADFKGRQFRYADTFAGYAFSPIIKGNDWKKGINNVLKVKDVGQKLRQNPHTKLWYEWYLQGRPQLLGGVYPGSSLIATDVCALRGMQSSLALWDTSPAVIMNLMEAYFGLGFHIFTRPAHPDEEDIKTADFLFIDPPSAKKKRKPNDPNWPDIVEFLLNSNQHTMIWLPVTVQKKC